MAERVERLTTTAVRQKAAEARLNLNGVQQYPALLAPKVNPGDVGKQIIVSTNLWGVLIAGRPIYLYHVTIEGTYPNGHKVPISGRYRDDALEVGRKDRCRAIFHAMIRKHALVLPNACYYDLQSLLFTFQPLNTFEWTCADIVPEDLEGVDSVNGFTQFSVTLKKAGSTPDPHCNTDDFSGVLAQNLDDLNLALNQFLEILIHQYALFNPQEHVCYEGATTYRMDPLACGFDPRDCFYLLPQFKSFAEMDVGDVYLAVGNRAVVKFIEGRHMRKSQGSIGVIIETRKSAFYAVGNFYVKCDRVTRGAVHDIRELTEQDFETIHRLFTGKQVLATHRVPVKPFKIYSISQNKTANNEMIARDGHVISINRYYHVVYGIQLEHPDAPLVESRIRRGRETMTLWYPIEVLQFMDNQRVKFNEQDPRMIRGILKGSAVLPLKRQEQNRLNAESHHLNDPEFNPYMAAAEASVTTNPLEVPARIIPAPAVQFASDRPVSMEDADGCTWKHPRNAHYLRPAVFPDWGVVHISVGAADDLSPEQAEFFVTKHFLPACGARGMQTRQQFFLHVIGTNETTFVGDLRELKKEYPTLEFLLVIHTNHETAACHSTLKRLETDLQFLTQGIRVSTVKNILDKHQRQTLEHVVNKTNVKMGGINYGLSIPRDPHLKFDISKTLIIGFGINNPMGREASEVDKSDKRVFPPSVIGYSANTNEDAFEFVGDYGFVDVAKAQDVDFMRIVVRRCLDLYQQSRGQLPNRIIIYRGDTPEGQYGKVLKYEVPMMYVAIEEMRCQAPITLIAHSRRQPLRLFQKPIPHGENDKGPQQNVKPGTVVDTTIVHPTLHQFYLNSHVALQGTAAVPRYDVLYDDNKLSANELETTTFWLAFGHQIVYLPTSLPSPVYIGDLYAKRGRDVYNSMKRLGEIEDDVDYQELSARVSYYESNLYKLRVNA